MILGIFTFLLEILYCYIILKEFDIIGKKKKIILFTSILAMIILSGIILNASIFRYLFLPISFFIIIKLLNNKNSVSYSVIIVTSFLIKLIVEYLTILIFKDFLNFMYINIIFEVLLFLIAIVISKFMKNIKNLVFKLWNGSKKFYFRYLFLIVTNIFILFTIYNLIKMKEVF